jgi:hypothetical protein
MIVEVKRPVQRPALKCLRWVKMRNTREEQMFSALPLTTDIAQRRRHVGKVPEADQEGRYV